MNIVEPILFQAAHNPPAPAICAPGTTLNVVSYARLARFINNIGRRAIASGIAPGDTVALHVKDDILHAAISLGLAHIGVVTVGVRTAEIPKTLTVDAMMTDEPKSAPADDTKTIRVDLGWAAGDGDAVDPRYIYRGSGNDICRISLTSGSTGESKAVGFTHAMQAARLARYDHAYGARFPVCARFFCDLWLGSSVGFRHLLYVLSRGGTMFLPGAEAMDTLQTFELYKVQCLLASPGGLSGFLKFYEENPIFHSGFEVIISTGSLLHDQLSERVRARLCQNLVFYYGTTETGTVSSAPAHALMRKLGAVGFVAPGVKVEIVDQAGSALPTGREGSLRIRSPVNVEGYLNDPEQTGQSFRGGCFYTGDTGWIGPDGMLFISGRDNDVLNLGGDKVRPQVVEDAILAFPPVDQAAVFSVPNDLGVDELWALVVPNAAFDERALRAHCGQTLGEGLTPQRFVRVDRLPRNENGKIERHRLKEMV
jgi:acyl-CoA synthetase (AMP-forming)/AMP-acid ligase II